MDQNTPQGRKSPLPWLLGILVIAALGVAVWRYLAPTQPTNTSTSANTNASVSTNASSNSTANVNHSTTNTSQEWQTYSSARKGFSVQYPNGWELIERLDGSVAFAPAGQLGKFPELSVYPMSTDSTTLELIKKSTQGLPLTNRVERDRTVNGLDTYIVSGTSPTPLTDGSFTQIDRAVLQAGAFVYELSGNDAGEYFDRMLESFAANPR